MSGPYSRVQTYAGGQSVDVPPKLTTIKGTKEAMTLSYGEVTLKSPTTASHYFGGAGQKTRRGIKAGSTSVSLILRGGRAKDRGL